MARLRFVQDPAKLKEALLARQSGPRKPNISRMVRAYYETDPEIAAALLPKPLTPGDRPEIMIQFSHVTMHPAPGKVVTSGTCTVGVAAKYRGREGWYVLMMPMEGEWVVISGRERFGEPKKLAAVTLEKADGRVKATVSRMGVTFLEVEGSIADRIEPREWTEHLWCYKALQEIETTYGFDGDVFLTQLNWERKWVDANAISDAKITLRESAADPIVDVPVRKIVRVAYAEGTSVTGGEILEKVPGEWLQPFFYGRYDDNATGGIEIALASERRTELA